MATETLPECQNLAEPLYLPIENTAVTDTSSTAKSWGITLGLGTPGQNVVLRPSLWQKTLVSRNDDCQGATDYDCLAKVGGTFDPQLSSTCVNLTASSGWNSTLSNQDTASDFHLYQDTLSFGGITAKGWGFPFSTWSEPGWTSSSYVGLGRNSSFLKTAVDIGAAAVTSWGLWPGSRSFESPADGLLILGAYDTARVDGDFKSFPSNDNCPACLQITDIEWVENGQSVSIFNDTTSALQIAMNPFSNTIELPQDLWTGFMQVTGGVYNTTLSSISYPAASVPTGSLNVTIQGAYSVAIPAVELFTFPRIYSSSGNLTASTTSLKIAQVYNYTNDVAGLNILATWGMPFMTMNYLVLDPEQDEFRLAKAIRQNFGTQGGAIPRKLCKGLVTPTTSTTTPPTPTSPPVETSSTVPSESPVPSSGSNTGAIVGGVVGGVGGLLLIALIVFFCLRRRNRRQETVLASSTQPPYDPMAQMYHSPASPMPPGSGPSPAPYGSPQGYPYGPLGPVFYSSHPDSSTGYPAPAQPYQQSQALPNPEYRGASPTQYSDATAVQELPSPPVGPGSQNDWRSSQGGSDFDPGKHVSATITSPVPMPGKPL